MTNITIKYNVFDGTLKFYVNEQPLPDVSCLAQLQRGSFLQWSETVFSMLYDEVNDAYSVTFVGRSCETRILAFYSKTDPHCRSFTTRIPDIPDSGLKRLKNLHMLCQNGQIFRKSIVEIPVFSDLEASTITGLFKSALPRLCYSSLRIKNMPIQSIDSCRGAGIIIISEKERAEALRMGDADLSDKCIIELSERTELLGIIKGGVWEKVRPEELPMAVKEKLELEIFPGVLKMALQNIQIQESNPEYYQYLALDKMEAISIPVFPHTLEFGQSGEFAIRTIPDEFSEKALSYRVSNEGILLIRDNIFEAVGEGEVLVEAYDKGTLQKVADGKITVVRRNRIVDINVTPAKIDIREGDTAHFEYSFTPEDADNVKTIKIVSEDGLIASADNRGTIKGRKPGVTKIFVRTDNNVKGECVVRVFPALQELKLKMAETTIRCGEYCSVNTERVPVEAVLEKLKYYVSPADVAEYDVAQHIIITKRNGKATLTVSDTNDRVKTTVSFMVKKKGLFK